MQRRFSRDLASLQEIFDFVAGFLAEHGISKENALGVDLIAEELFTNFLKYNAGGEQEIEIRLRELDGAVELRLTDPGAQPFDITRVPEPDLTLPIARRTPGGLGLHLVRRLAEKITYEHAGGDSIVTVVKRLEG
jgi:anti-sigma regulatory factor (Ser/Thr protein kinase)